MFELFSDARTVSIVLLSDEKCIKLAVLDLQENLRSLSGNTDGFAIVTTPSGRDITVLVDSHTAPKHAEGYRVEVGDNGVKITGSDALGAVYGMYAFATKCLGIDPLYRFTDMFPTIRERMVLDDTEMISHESSTRFRGWFINDEDLLSCYAKSGAKRKITYNQDFFKEVISVEMMDVIFESALRLGMNMIIPCSFIDILNPAEEAIVLQAVRRGLYVSQHHQEPVGVAYFAAENYMAEHYPGKAVSYVDSPDEMKDVWRTYIEKWATYGEHVIWQLGLRGKGDNAVWYTDGSVDSSAAKRGAVISEAIATQHRIIAETLGYEDFISTVTLWLEGAALYDAGHLTMPKNTITVFGDIGYTQLFGGDFYRVSRRKDCKYGIYYHAGFYGEGPHLADGTDPDKMVFCYREAEKYDSLYFSVLNVANIRELCSSIRLNAAILAVSPSRFELTQYYDTVYPMLYGDVGKAIAELDRKYFDAIGDIGNELGKEIISYTDFHYYEHKELPFPYYPLADGTMVFMGRRIMGVRWRDSATPYAKSKENLIFLQDVLQKSEEKYDRLLSLTKDTEKIMPKELVSYYRFSQIFRARLMLDLTRWMLCVSKMRLGENVEENRSLAVRSLEDILACREEFSRGKWQGWYSGDKRLNLSLVIEETLSFQYNNKES